MEDQTAQLSLATTADVNKAQSLITNQSEGLTIRSNDAYLSPQLSIQEAVDRHKYFLQVIQTLLVESVHKYGDDFGGSDYGKLPGTQNRCLYKTGAEKLALFFGLRIDLSLQAADEDWSIPFFRYRYKATAYRNGQQIGEAIRNCHTMEDKYRFSWVAVMPEPSKDEQRVKTIMKTGRRQSVWIQKKQEWIWCEKLPNPSIWDLQNTVDAMAQKRAYVACVKQVLAAASYFASEVIDYSELDAGRDEEGITDGGVRPAPVARQSNGGAKPQADGRKAESPEIERANTALRGYCINQKGEKNGGPYFESFWMKKPGAERLAEATRLGLLSSPATDAVDAELIEDEPADYLPDETPAIELTGDAKQRKVVLDMIVELKSLGMTQADINEEIHTLCDGQTKIDNLSLGDLTGLVAEFGKKIDQLIAAKEANGNKKAKA